MTVRSDDLIEDRSGVNNFESKGAAAVTSRAVRLPRVSIDPQQRSRDTTMNSYGVLNPSVLNARFGVVEPSRDRLCDLLVVLDPFGPS